MEELKKRQQLVDLINKVSSAEGFKQPQIVDVQTNTKGSGFLGEFFMVTVEDETKKRLELAVKVAFENEKVRQVVPIKLCFENEVHFYANIVPAFKTLMEQQVIQEVPQFAPICYQNSLEDSEECLILQNLSTAGFEVLDTTLILNDEQIRMIFKAYGRFHACSLALQDQKPQVFQQLANNSKNVHEKFAKIFSTNVKDLCQRYIDNKITFDDVVLEKLKKYTGEGAAERFTEVLTTSCEPSALLHGDCWSNNMMFKYCDSGNGKVLEEMRLIDFQLVKPGSVVCDLSYFFYTGATKEAFDKLDEYLKVYHDSLSEFLVELGSDPQIFPMSTLKDQWRSYSKLGFLMSVPIVRIKLITNKLELTGFSDGVDAAEASRRNRNAECDQESYYKRIEEIIQHLSDIDAL